MPFRAKLKQAIPACPAVLFLSGYGSFLCYYAHFLYILFPSFRILTAAFTSRSIRFPHSHRYIRSDNASSFFLCPHTLHILLDAKYLSTFIRYFPRSSSLYPSMAKSIPRNFFACLFSAVWFSQSNNRLAKYFPDGSLLTVTDFSFHPSGIIRWSFIFTGCIFGSFRNLSCRQIFPFTIFVV